MNVWIFSRDIDRGTYIYSVRADTEKQAIEIMKRHARGNQFTLLDVVDVVKEFQEISFISNCPEG